MMVLAEVDLNIKMITGMITEDNPLNSREETITIGPTTITIDLLATTDQDLAPDKVVLQDIMITIIWEDMDLAWVWAEAQA